MRKGFTLFTALVGVLLVVLGVLLAQSMSSTERSTTEIIAENRLDQEMIDAAVLAQADSLQEFNFGLRSAMEKYFSHDYAQSQGYDNYYELESENWNAPLEEIVSDFEDLHFGTNLEQVAGFTADELSATLPGVKRTPDFLIRIPDFDKTNFKEKLKIAFQPVSGTGNIIEKIECDGVNNCQRGTFYINLDFSADPSDPNKLSDLDYESLPKIEVIKKSTCTLATGQNDVSDTINLNDCVKKIRIPIVPRAKIRVLVPLRIFKAITLAQQVASEVFDDETNDRLDDVKLGVCDSKEVVLQCCDRFGRCTPYYYHWYSCRPRNKVEISGSEFPDDPTSMAKVCIGHEADEQDEEHRLNLGNLGSYDPYDLSTAKRPMEEYTFKEILLPKANNSRTIDELLEPDAEFALTKFPIYNTESVFYEPRLENHSPVFGSRSLGFDSDNDMKEDYSRCSKINKLWIGLVFEEKNQVYTLDPSGSSFTFQVRLVKNDFKDFDYKNADLSDYEEVTFCPSNPDAPSCTGSPPPTCPRP